MASDLLRNLFTVVAFTFIFALTDRSNASSDAYSDIVKLTRNTIDNPDFNKDLRPLLNQSHTMTVMFNFSVVSLVSVDDVTQSCTINGFLMFTWMDELIRWNISDYGGFDELQTQPYKLWHPRLILMNVVGEREVIEGNGNPIVIQHTGSIRWTPGAILSAACDLDVRKFPFDEQICEIFFCPMDYFTDKLVFVAPFSEADKAFFHSNKGWEMTKIIVSVRESTVSSGVFSCPSVIFHFKRRPAPFIFNVLAPVLMLSFINLFVFTIPAESGEKISYGITVLVAMSVYLSQVNSMLPDASDHPPAVTMYLFFLMVNSVVSVLASIATVFLHNSNGSNHKEKQDVNFLPSISENGINMNTSEIEFKGERPRASNRIRDVCTISPKRRYHWISKHINRISLAFFLISWIVVSLWFFIYVKI